jgi:hypothetical protein
LYWEEQGETEATLAALPGMMRPGGAMRLTGRAKHGDEPRSAMIAKNVIVPLNLFDI